MLLIILGKEACVVAPVEMPLQPSAQQWALSSEGPRLQCPFELVGEEAKSWQKAGQAHLPEGGLGVLGLELPWSLNGASL